MPAQESTQRECPYCHEPQKSQGLFMHVRNTEGEGHGPYGEVPDGFNVRDAPIISGERVKIKSLQQDAQKPPNKLLICNYCGKASKGERGLSIHLSKSAGDEMHPKGASIKDGNYSSVPADENYNPLIDEETLDRIRQREVEDTQKAAQHFEVVSESDSEPMSAQEVSDAREQAASTDEEIDEQKEELYIPEHAQKTEQVASLMKQEPGLYNRPELVRDLVDCSRTTFYEGRKLYDANADVQTEPEPSEEEDRLSQVKESLEQREGDDIHTVTVDGVTMIPITELEEIVEGLNERLEKFKQFN